MNESNLKNLVIVVPTYNEKENIISLLNEIGTTLINQSIKTTVIIVDDNSPDGTADLVLKNTADLAQEFSNLKINLIHREGKLGLGTAYIRGFQEALKLNADYIVEMDADFSHQPKYLIQFLEAIKNADLVIGSRYVNGGGTENWGLIRKILSQGAGFYARTILGMKVKDMTAGYKMYRAEVLKIIGIENIKSSGYSFQIELKYRTFKKGFKIVEVPIIFPDRVNGQSKINKIDTIKKTLLMVVKMRFRGVE